MSDQETKKTEESSAELPVAAPVVQAQDKSAAPAKASSGIAWFAILLVLVLAAGAAWVVMEAQRREGAMVNRVTQLEASNAQLESGAAQKQTNLGALSEGLEGKFEAGLRELEATVSGETARLSKNLQSIEGLLSAQRKELARFSSTDRDSWLIAEAEYLLRLANQRLIMAGDTEAAQALLSSADSVLRELDDTSLHAVRGAVAADLAAVRAVAKVDVEGTYLRLAALVGQTGALKIFQMPKTEEQPRPEAAADWQGKLRQGYKAALSKLSDYIIIRRRDEPMQTLMDPQWEGLVRQNMRMLLEQAQVALLSGNQTLYTESLGRAQHWVAEFAETDEAAAQALARELTQLADIKVAVVRPDISGSLTALDKAIERRRQQGGDE